MQNISTVAEIKDAIRQLKEKQVVQGQELKASFLFVVDSVRPINLIKSTFSDVTSSPDLMSNILSTTIGLTAGYLTNKTLLLSTGGALKNCWELFCNSVSLRFLSGILRLLNHWDRVLFSVSSVKRKFHPDPVNGQ